MDITGVNEYDPEPDYNELMAANGELRSRLADTRAWARLWKHGARHYRARLHLAADVAAKYIMEASMAKMRVEALEKLLRQALLENADWYTLAAREAERLLEGKEEPASCQWQYDEYADTWEAECGASWWLLGGQAPSDADMIYCPSCGHRIDEGEEFEAGLLEDDDGLEAD